ncbi:hypothetical protein ACTFIW_012968 [Dictyostelium discoideum]
MNDILKPIIIIKKLKDCDKNEFTKLWNESHSDHFHNWQKTREEIEKRNKLYKLSEENSKVAFINDKQVGFILTATGEVDGKLVGWNGATAVLKQYRRFGIATLLYNEILNDYKKQGIEQALLDVITINEGAKKLYTKLGFQIKSNYIVLYSTLNENQNKNHKNLIKNNNNNNNYNEINFIKVLDGFKPYHKLNQPLNTQYQNLIEIHENLINIEKNGEIIGFMVYSLTFDKCVILLHQLFLKDKCNINNEIITEIFNYFYKKYCIPTNTEKKIYLTMWDLNSNETKFMLQFNDNEFKKDFEYYSMKLDI